MIARGTGSVPGNAAIVTVGRLSWLQAKPLAN